MHIVVTGGAGFIGSNFISMLLKNSDLGFEIDELTIIDTLTYAGNLKNIEGPLTDSRVKFSRTNIADKKAIPEILKGVDVVVNFAAESHVDRSLEDAGVFIESNIQGVQVLLDACIQQGVKSFIQISTDEVYGTVESGSWTEESILNPRSPYSSSKASADLLALSYFYSFGLDVRITRCCNNYGPFQNTEKAIPKFITNLLINKKIPVYGDGSNIREWIHVSDHCRAIGLVINSGLPGNIYNIGSPEELSNIEMVRQILDYFDKDVDEIDWVADRKGHDKRYSLDTTKITQTLGFKNLTSFSMGLPETIKWYKANSEWWK